MCNFKLTMVKVHHLEDTNLPSTTVHQGKLKVTEHVHRVGNLYLRKDDDGLPWMLVNALQVMVAGGSLRKIPGTQACYELTTKQDQTYQELKRVEKGCCGRMMQDLGLSWNRYTFWDGTVDTDAEIREDRRVESVEICFIDDLPYLCKTFIGRELEGVPCDDSDDAFSD